MKIWELLCKAIVIQLNTEIEGILCLYISCMLPVSKMYTVKTKHRCLRRKGFILNTSFSWIFFKLFSPRFFNSACMPVTPSSLLNECNLF